ncbi:uncharacterized protein LOC128985497 [Macrosteles quadrilineatus]|uniref:uncharacterized protein LOC128985497 n=1 Tax=Macrosteles quadrilineatus TaxID=74068 RepID=UPI0023E2CAF4|nr:uncharacterized protein LOC128985497 [Macrosteles quadrilineatus]
MRAWAQCKTLKRNNDVHQQAKVDHNANRIKEKEDSLADLREQCTTAMLRENTVNNEVTSHLETAIGNLQKKIEKWTARYSKEVDSLDIALLLLKSKIEDQHEKFNKMTEQYSAKLELLESLHTEADDRDRELEIRIARSKAAFIIQHWWRGVLAKRGAEKKKSSGKNRKKSKKSSTKRKKRKQSPKRKNK